MTHARVKQHGCLFPRKYGAKMHVGIFQALKVRLGPLVCCQGRMRLLDSSLISHGKSGETPLGFKQSVWAPSMLGAGIHQSGSPNGEYPRALNPSGWTPAQIAPGSNQSGWASGESMGALNPSV